MTKAPAGDPPFQAATPEIGGTPTGSALAALISVIDRVCVPGLRRHGVCCEACQFGSSFIWATGYTIVDKVGRLPERRLQLFVELVL